MMRDNQAESIFHNVGQGLFYSGRIKMAHTRSFNFVYDCGTKSPRHFLDQAITAYKNHIQRNQIDLLVLSHFDIDHINGVDKLLSDVAVDKVVIPYFTPIERLIIGLRNPGAPEKSDDEKPYDWYFDFLSDPVSFLIKNKKANQVIIVGGDSETEEYAKTKFKFSDQFREDDIGKNDLNFIKMHDDWQLKKQISEHDPNWVQENKLLVKNHLHSVPLSNYWIFKFFNYKVEEDTLEGFHNCLKNIGIDPDDSNALREIIRSKEERKKIKMSYSKLRMKSNDTSLVLYHGPIKKPKHVSLLCNYCIQRGYECFPFYLTKHLCEHDSNRFGHLLTGDIDLNHKRNIELLKHYDEFKNQIKIVQVPHHGSVENWNSLIMLDLLGHERWFTLWCVSAGILNAYGHPSPDVIDELSRWGCVQWSNEHNRITIKGVLEV